MYPLIEGFSSSGLTCKAYAKSLGMKYGTYKYWVRKYRADQKHESNKSGSSNFIPLQIIAEKVKEHSAAFSWKSDAANRLSFSVFLVGFDIFRAVSMAMVLLTDLSIGEMIAVFGYLWFMMGPVQEVLSIHQYKAD